MVVREPPPPPPEVKEGEPPPPPPPPRTDPGLDQGMLAVIVETLSPADLQPAAIRELEKAKKHEQEEQAKRAKSKEPPVLAPPDYGPAIAKPPVRYYVAVGANGGDNGTPTQRIAVPVEPAPPEPSPPEIAVAEGHLELAWKAPEGLRRPILLTVLPPKAPAAAAATQRAAANASQPAADGADGATEEDDGDTEDEEGESRVPPAQGGIDAPRMLTLQNSPSRRRRPMKVTRQRKRRRSRSLPPRRSRLDNQRQRAHQGRLTRRKPVLTVPGRAACCRHGC